MSPELKGNLKLRGSLVWLENRIVVVVIVVVVDFVVDVFDIVVVAFNICCCGPACCYLSHYV